MVGLEFFKLFVQQPVKVGHRAKKRIYVNIIGHIIAKIVHGGGVNGREPDGIYVEALQVIQPLANAGQVADAVIVAILVGARVNLVNDAFLSPKQVFIHG